MKRGLRVSHEMTAMGWSNLGLLLYFGVVLILFLSGIRTETFELDRDTYFRMYLGARRKGFLEKLHYYVTL